MPLPSPLRDALTPWIDWAHDIGATPAEDESQRLRRRLLLLGGALMAGGGMLCGTICVALNYPEKSAVPYG